MNGDEQPALELPTVLVARCKNYREDLDAACAGRIRFGWGQSQAACDTCGAYCGIAVAAWERVEPAHQSAPAGDDEPRTLTAPVGEFLADELAARNIQRRVLRRPLGLTDDQIDALITGSLPLTETIAHRLGTFLGTSAQLWLNLDRAHRGEVDQPAPAEDAELREAETGSVLDRAIQVVKANGYDVVSERIYREELSKLYERGRELERLRIRLDSTKAARDAARDELERLREENAQMGTLPFEAAFLVEGEPEQLLFRGPTGQVTLRRVRDGVDEQNGGQDR